MSCERWAPCADAEDHQRQQFVDAEPAVLEMIDVSVEFLGEEEARAGEHPVVGVAIEQDLAHARELDRRGVGEEQVTVAEAGCGRIERDEMLLQVAPLDELRPVLLIDRHEHPQDVLEQVAAALGDAVEEHRRAQRRGAKRRPPRRACPP